MSMMRNHGSSLRRFAAETRGAALVEFAITMPLMLLVFAVIIESGRMFWSYQAAIDGVRDATRYVARVAPADICDTGGSLAGYSEKLTEIVEESTSGSRVFGPLITLDSVSPGLDCTMFDAPLARVSAQLTVQFPFSSIFVLIGGSALADMTTVVTDSSRIYGT